MRNDEVAWDDSTAAGWTDKDGCGRPHEEEGEELWEEVARRSGSEHRIVSVKWVETNKVTVKSKKIRCNLVATDFRGADTDREDLFASTPLWELKKTASVTCGGQVERRT